MKLGEMLYNRRIKLGYSLQHVANKVNVSKVTIYRWEKGESKDIPISKLMPLSVALNISPTEILACASPEYINCL